MAQILNLFLVMVAVFAKKNEAFGGIEERLQRMRAKLNGETENQPKPSYNEKLDDLVALLKTGTLKALCESEKVSPIWCEYKQLIELNAVYRLQQQKSVKKKSSGSLCWPGLPLPCKGLVSARNARAAYDYEADNEFDNDGKHETHYDSNNDAHSANDADEEKRGMKCRPGFANCRRKKGKRTVTKAKVCPQGWMFC